MTKEHPTQQIYQVIAAIVPSQSSIVALSPSVCANGEVQKLHFQSCNHFELTPIIISYVTNTEFCTEP